MASYNGNVTAKVVVAGGSFSCARLKIVPECGKDGVWLIAFGGRRAELLVAMHFDAYVSGIPDYGNIVRAAISRDEARYQIAKMRIARDEVARLLGQDSKKSITSLFRQKHAPVSHLYLERDSFLKPLREWISRNLARFGPQTHGNQGSNAATLSTKHEEKGPRVELSSSSQMLKTIPTSQTTASGNYPTVKTMRSPFRALEALGLNDALIVPIELPKPLLLEIPERAYRLPVVSAQMLLDEIRELDRELATGKVFLMPKVPDFFYAKACDIQRLARLEGLTDRFWVRFAAVVLTHLAETSLESGLCGHISDRPITPN